jgi:UPF0271 protein
MNRIDGVARGDEQNMKIDLNCDMGESFGRYSLGNDAAVMPFISSANIACGLHAGDPIVMRSTILLALQHGVTIGAHPGWPDLQGFGRREMNLAPDEVEAFVIYQVGALAALAKTEGSKLRHVKPHGALYNQAARDRALAAAIARAVTRFDKNLILVGLAGSALITCGQELGLKVANEGFPDRRYNPDGTLVSRKEPHAILESPEEVAAHAVILAQEGIDFAGKRTQVDTLCLHGDNTHAAENAKMVRETLANSGIEVKAL